MGVGVSIVYMRISILKCVLLVVMLNLHLKLLCCLLKKLSVKKQLCWMRDFGVTSPLGGPFCLQSVSSTKAH